MGYTICWWNLSWDKIDFKDARMCRAGRVRHDTHVNMSWNHVHIAVEISKFFFSRLIWNSLAFWSPLRACAFTLSANYLLVLPAIMHEHLLTLPFAPYFPWEFQGRQLGAIIVRFERIADDPIHRTIPYGSIHSSKLDYGRADTSVGAHDGSEIFRLNKWTTTWGSQGALHGHRGNSDRGGSP